MQVQRITNPAGIDDIKLIAETESEKAYLRQLAETGTLVSRSSNASSSLVLRPLSVSNPAGDSLGTLISRGAIGKLDFTLRQNENFSIGLKFKNRTANTPLDLSVYDDIKLQLRDRRSGEAIVSLAVGAGLTISGDDNDSLVIAVTPDQSVLLTKDDYDYDTLMIQGATKTYYLEGIVKIERTGTR